MDKKMIAALAVILSVSAFGAKAASVNIDQNNLKFAPNTATIKAGDALVFMNNDDVTHNINVIDADGDAADQGLQKPKQSITTKFDKAGEFQVRCAIHPKMKMTVTVQ